MSAELYGLADKYVERCQQELEEILDRPGIVVIDNSFPNGFVTRRMFREEFYPSLAEAFHIEAGFQRAFYSNLPDNVAFPPEMRAEHGAGIRRLISGMDDPQHALRERWGGRGGEPAMIEYKMIPHEYEGDEHYALEVGSNMRELIEELQIGSHIQRMMTAEAYLAGKRRVETHSSLALPNVKVKSYYVPKPIEHFAPVFKSVEGICEHHSFQTVPIRPIRTVRAALRNSENDNNIWDICDALSYREPVTLMTADVDFKTKHHRSYGTKRREGSHGVTVFHDGHKYTDILEPVSAA